MNDLKTVPDLEEEFRVLQAKLASIEQKKLALLQAEGELRTDMQRVENQIYRLKRIQKTL